MGVGMSHYYSALNAVEKAVVGVAVEFKSGCGDEPLLLSSERCGESCCWRSCGI